MLIVETTENRPPIGRREPTVEVFRLSAPNHNKVSTERQALGSWPSSDFPPEDLWIELNGPEAEELRAWARERHRRNRITVTRSSAHILPLELTVVTDGVSRGDVELTPETAEGLREAMTRLERALTAAGF